MRTLLVLSLLLTFTPSTQQIVVSPESAVVVLGFKCDRSRRAIETPVSEPTQPTAEMIPANKNYARNARINNPVGAKDPNEDTIDGRSAALEKIVQEARTPKPKLVDGFVYRVRVQNVSARVVEIVFWEYQFIDPVNPTTITRRQFLCGVNIKPDKGKQLLAFSLAGPSDVVSVESLASNSETVLQERVLINRVEYADGTIWQRKDWKFAEIKLTYQRAVATPWGSDMCRTL